MENTTNDSLNSSSNTNTQAPTGENRVYNRPERTDRPTRDDRPPQEDRGPREPREGGNRGGFDRNRDRNGGSRGGDRGGDRNGTRGANRNGGRGGRRGPGGFGQQNPYKKTDGMTAVASDSPTYMVRNRSEATLNLDNAMNGALASLNPVKNIKSTNIRKGNLAAKLLNPVFTHGIDIHSNSPKVFPEGPAVRVIPIGGVNEVGMNMTAIECGDDIIIVDTGFGFGGGDRYPGVDYIIPDTSYLEANLDKIRGLIYTHGHLDHIGGAPYILPKLGNIPIYGMPLTLALLKNRLQEFELQDKFVGKILDITQPLTLGCFTVDFFRLNHSIPDVLGLAIKSPMGTIAYCTDWKFDMTPFDGMLSDYGKLAEIGDEGVRLLMTDSLGILKPGWAVSERVLEQTIAGIFAKCQGRIVFTTFSTTIARLQHCINGCIKTNRKLGLVGRSMINNFNVCFSLGYIKVPEGLVVDFNELAKLPPERVCILSTGSQGEDNAALNRMARDEHDQIRLMGGDSVIFSSKPIPGNEDAVQDLIARLSRKGVEVYMHKEFDLHVSGHACHEDLKLLMALTRPEYLMPIHGDHFMLRKVAELGEHMGIPYEKNLLVENNRITELRSQEIYVTDEVIGEAYIMVDGTGVGAVSEIVLEERRQMATQGSLIITILVNKQKKLVGGPEIISRGFVYMKASATLFDDIKEVVRKKFAMIDIDPNSKTYWADMRNSVRNITRDFVYEKTEKDPVIIPVIIQI
jgi:ribonuclease J